MKNKIFLLSIGSGGMNILNDIKSFKIKNCQFLYINNIDYEAKEDGFEPIFDNIDKKEKIILEQDNLEKKFSIFFKTAKQINIIITLGGKTVEENISKILNYFFQNFSIKVNIYTTYPFNFEDKKIIKRANNTLEKIKQFTNNVFVFQNDKLLEKGDNVKMKELFKSLSEEIYNHIKMEGNHDL